MPQNQASKALAAEPSQQGHTEQNPIKAFAHDTFDYPIAVFTLFLVGSTIMLWLATLKLAREGRKGAIEQNTIAKDTAKRQQRAYVMAEDQAVTGLFRGGPATCHLKVFNRGQTPAYGVRIWSIVGGTQTNPDDLKVSQRAGDDFRQSVDVIGPGNFITHKNDCQAPMSEAAYVGVATGGIKLVFAGVISHKDAFGQRHFATFKQFYTGNGNWATQGGDMTSCGRGNLAN